MRSIWIWILPGIYKVEKLKRGISLYVFSRLFDVLLNMVLKYAIWRFWY